MAEIRYPDVPEHLLEVGASFEQTYIPVLDFRGWRVAMLRHSDANDPAHFQQVERHNETNEVFILTAGQADLVICDDDAGQPIAPAVFAMQHNVAYNIQQSVWHNVVMTTDAHIILFERTDTTVENSNYAKLSADVVAGICEQFSI
ncbi:MAG: ureidoglycolate lyase [Chloroflexota bacterium]